MSVNSQTYLKLKVDSGTIGASGVLQFTTTDNYVHSIEIGVAGAGTVYVGESTVTATNQFGKALTSASTYKATSIANDRGTIALNRKDYWVAGAEGVIVFMLYHEEVQLGN